MKVVRSRELRRDQTTVEQLVWERLRNKQLLGLKFRRQQVIDGFIADFYCNEAGLVVELDGGVHETREDADIHKEAVLRARGLSVLRFTNEEVLYSLDEVCTRIEEACRRGLSTASEESP